MQDTGLAQVQLDESGLETVVRIDRPATVGEHLELRCASTDVRAGIYRLEEAHRLPAQQVLILAQGCRHLQLQYLRHLLSDKAFYYDCTKLDLYGLRVWSTGSALTFPELGR